MADLAATLKQYKLKNTSTRRVVLQLFYDFEYALSYSDIESQVKGKLDKVTIYRTLKSFQENGIIHEIHDQGSQSKYALCSHGTCSSHDHHDSHAHFKCTDCEHTYCLDDVKIPSLSLPKNFQASDFSLLVQGVCEKCSV